jgi:hypothetical protein
MNPEIEIINEATMVLLQWQKVLASKFSPSSKEMEELKANFTQKANYGYIVAKAARYLVYCKYAMDYGEGDIYNYPMEKEWDMRSVHLACMELVYDVKGLSVNDCFTVSPVVVRELYEMFHFTFMDFEETENSNVIKMHFMHKKMEEKCYAFCACNDTSVFERHPFYLKLMVQGDTPKKRVFVTVCERGPMVKIYTKNHSHGIAAEYAWARVKFPGSKKTIQRYGEQIIDGKSIRVDVMTFKLSDGTTKEIVFDLSDFKEYVFN